jgi:hypothetical protein
MPETTELATAEIKGSMIRVFTTRVGIVGQRELSSLKRKRRSPKTCLGPFP